MLLLYVTRLSNSRKTPEEKCWSNAKHEKVTAEHFLVQNRTSFLFKLLLILEN